MRVRVMVVLVTVVAMVFTTLAPGLAAADGGSTGPYYLAVPSAERYVRGGEVLREEDFTEDFRPRTGDQIFFNEVLYHSTARGARGSRAGRSTITCLVGIRMTFFCDGTFYLRGRGELYGRTSTANDERFLIAILGGTREFKASRGDVVAQGLSRGRTLYQLRLR